MVMPPAAKRGRYAFSLEVPKRENVPGTLMACGMNELGQLGLGDENERKRPTAVTSLKDVVDISAGGMHSICLTKDGKVYTFGCNDEGTLGRDTEIEGSDLIPGQVELPGKVVKISAGDSHSACLLEDGRVFAWGNFRNSHGVMGLFNGEKMLLPVEILPGVKCCDISSGTDHVLILSCEGFVYSTGCGEQGQLGRVSLRTASGDTRNVAYGGISGDLFNPGEIKHAKLRRGEAIWATMSCSFVRKLGTDEIYAWGLNNFSQLALQKPRRKMYGGVVTSPLLSDLKDIKKIAGGQHHTLALTKHGKVMAIGRHDYGRLGLGTREDSNELASVHTLNNVNIVDISCGVLQSFAVDSDGNAYSWGMGSNFQLGTGKEDDEEKPVLITSKSMVGKKVLKISGGGQHTLFLVTDSNLNNNYQKEDIQQKQDGNDNTKTENSKSRKRKA